MVVGDQDEDTGGGGVFAETFGHRTQLGAWPVKVGGLRA